MNEEKDLKKKQKMLDKKAKKELRKGEKKAAKLHKASKKLKKEAKKLEREKKSAKNKDGVALTKAHFDKNAKRYDQKMGNFAIKLYRTVLDYTRAEDPYRVLDLGCGTGNIIGFLWQKKPEAKYYGIDISPKMLAVAERKLSIGIKEGSITLSQGNVDKLPFGDNTMDVVICNAAFHHYTKPEEPLQEIRRVLRDRGHLVLGDPCPATKGAAKKANKGKHASEYHIYTQNEFKEILEKNGFVIEEFKRPIKNSCVIKAKKKSSGRLISN